MRHNTWYLASDQFAFLTFADDLAHGRVFHDPATLELLTGLPPPPTAAVDAYYQTYIWRGGRLYSRYPPGYPALLAMARTVGGDPAVHWLNPLLYLLLVVVLARLAVRLDGRSGWVAGATMAWALLVIPAEVHYWGITVARDLPAHLLALGALLAMLDARPGLAGLLLGLAASIRPDAVLWGVSLGALAGMDRPGRAALARGALAFAVGALPLFAYNTVTQGSPLAFTQGSEFRHLFSRAAPVATVVRAGVLSGGAFRLGNLPGTLAVHVRYLIGSFGAFLGVAVAALVRAARGRPALAAAIGPYAVASLLFYSCWGHGDPRYLVGLSLALLLLAAVGCVDLAAAVVRPSTSRAARALAAALTLVVGVASGLVLPRDPDLGLTALERVTAAAIAGAGAVGLVSSAPALLAAAPLAPALAMAGFGIARIAASSGSRDPFQSAQVARARATLEAALPPGAIVLTTPALGRPAENVTHYTRAAAFYAGELGPLGSNPDVVAVRCLAARRRLFFLLPAGDPLPLVMSPALRTVREVERRQGDALLDWFIYPPRAPRGAVLYEVTVTPPTA